MNDPTKIDDALFERLIDGVFDPVSYVGNETNSVVKEDDSVAVAIALAFPDRYEIGMSHHGLRILYNLVNAEPRWRAERVFAPGDDFADRLEDESVPLFTLESRRALGSFDLVGFTIPYELSYTTMLRMLELAKIPLLAADRSESDPLIIGGGSGVYNPEPLAPFFDIFALGDGELALPAILSTLERFDRGKRARGDLIAELGAIEGIYAPSLFDVGYRADGEIDFVRASDLSGKRVRRVWVDRLEKGAHPAEMLVPTRASTQDRATIEIDRGCVEGCRFCQAGYTYRPARERPVEETIEALEKTIDLTGYESASLLSLSAGDYSRIEELTERLSARLARRGVALSLPSMRPSTVRSQTLGATGLMRKGSITIAAEAGSARLRRVINKNVTDEEIFHSASLALKAGRRSIKVYFMIGLPTETVEDVDAIGDIGIALSRLQVGAARFKTVTISVGAYVPKSFTPFQWIGQEPRASLEAKRARLFKKLAPHKRIKISTREVKVSFIEAVFARGDRRLAPILIDALEAGSRFEGWSENFDYDRWMRIFANRAIDPTFYANRAIALDATLPWDHLDIGLEKEFFQRELARALKGKRTYSCRDKLCYLCGLDPDQCADYKESARADAAPAMEEETAPPDSLEAFASRYVARYQKRSGARFFSMAQTRAIFLRAARRAKFRFAMSAGFSPHPKISLGDATPVGVESFDERLDFTLLLTEPISASELKERLNRLLPPTLQIVSLRGAAPDEPSAQRALDSIEYRIDFDRKNPLDRAALALAVENFNRAERARLTRPKRDGSIEVDLKKSVTSLEFDHASGSIFMTVKKIDGARARPSEVVFSLCGARAAHVVVKLKEVGATWRVP